MADVYGTWFGPGANDKLDGELLHGRMPVRWVNDDYEDFMHRYGTRLDISDPNVVAGTAGFLERHVRAHYDELVPERVLEGMRAKESVRAALEYGMQFLMEKIHHVDLGYVEFERPLDDQYSPHAPSARA